MYGTIQICFNWMFYSDKDNPELQMWTKNWDRELEKKKKEEEKRRLEEQEMEDEAARNAEIVIKTEICSPGGDTYTAKTEVNESNVTFFIGGDESNDTIEYAETGETDTKLEDVEETVASTCEKDIENQNKDNKIIEKCESNTAVDKNDNAGEGGSKAERGLSEVVIQPPSASSSATELHDYSRVKGASVRTTDRKVSGQSYILYI